MAATGSPMVHTVRRLRSAEFAWTAEATYLNNASIGPLPERTRRVLDDFSAQRTAPHRLSDRELHDMLATTRKTIARLLNAEVEEIALCPNTSLGLSIAAGALPLERGDTVLLSDREFPSNVYPWLRLRERGMAVELAPTTDLGWPNEAYLLERLRDPAVRVLAISFVQFSNGFRADLARLGERCRANGTYLVVDAIQGLGQCPLDIRSVPVDMLASGGQKWLLSPWGSGFLYVRRELVTRLDPPVLGWMSFEGTDDFTHLTQYDTTLRGDARRFEVATLPFQDMLGMAESVNLLLDIGIEPIQAYLETLRRPLFDAAARGDIEVISPMDGVHESAIVCVRLPHVAEAYHRLRQAGVVCVMREGAIRLSPHCYNTVDEMEKVVELLRGR
ncbi:MAG: aminotransferase class V-fold PLP-dependent enzyme [Gemmatimonadota bacterium]|nr:aminotransferase class V-fold PLP-dependent enzyme [Gemmatimonadota bacterium]